jgi:hypothetical protein
MMQVMQQIPHEAQLAPDARATLQLLFKETLRRWDSRPWSSHRTPDSDLGIRSVKSGIALCAASLAPLQPKKGERVVDARRWLTERHETLTAALEMVGRLGVALDGPLASELIARIDSSQAAVAAAHEAFLIAAPDTVASAREALDRAQAEERALNRELGALVAACALPKAPAKELFAAAKSQTDAIISAAATGKPASALHAALSQGADAARDTHSDAHSVRLSGSDIARLWVCYEPDTDPGNLFSWRWRRFQEGR